MMYAFLYAVILRALLATGSGAPASEAGGWSWRLPTEQGPVRLWVPEGYDPSTAATVIYVHGYLRDPDGVWALAGLPGQFRASGRNALFVVPAAATSDRAPMRWGRLSELQNALARRGVTLPAGPVVAVGHSGAYRTLARWVDDPRVASVVLLDALYGAEEAFARFAARGGRLVMVGLYTARRSLALLRRFPGASRRADLPAAADGFTHAERAAAVLYSGTHLGHAELNDSGQAIPALLDLVLPEGASGAVLAAN